jgi:Carboxypeptidase regulatory-like domain
MGSPRRTPRPPRSLLRPLALLVLAATPPLAAQSVRGELVDKTNGTAIDGAFVVLVDQHDQEVARALTGDAGSFLLRAPQPGTYRLQSRRIGFRVAASPAFTLSDGQELAYRLEVEAIPAELPPVVVEGRPQCGTSGDAGTVVAQLWDDAREALAAVQWTAGRRWYDMAIDLYERDLNADGRRVVRERSWSRRGSWQTPFRSISADSLAAVGYVVGNDRAGYMFYAPDPDVLLSEKFLDTHCFSAREGKGADSGLVGLSFAPAPRHRAADVRGVLWLARRTAELRKLEFQYVNVPPSLRETNAGGREDFLRLQTGAWVIMRWDIRMPDMAEVMDPAGRISPHFTVQGYHVTGGHVSAIRSSGGALVYAEGQAILEGVVVDSTRSSRPLAGAVVGLAGTDYATRTDSDGHFEVSAPMDGTYDVVFQHPRLDSLGGRAPPHSVTLTRGRRTQVTLAVPPEARLARALCPTGLADSEVVIVGRVTGGLHRIAVAGATVRATWQVYDQALGLVTAQPWTASVTTDSTGHYVLCGVPATTRLSLQADSGRVTGRAVTLRFGGGGVWIGAGAFRSLTGPIWMQELGLAP